MASRVLTITIGNDNIKLCDVSYSAQKSIQVLAAVSVPTPASACEDDVCNASLLVHKPFSPVFLLTAAGYSGCCESYILFAGVGMIRDINSPLAYKVFAVKSVKGFLIA